MMGSLSASFVNISTPFTIQMANSTPIAIQSILDMMAPGLLPLAAVFGIYAFLKKKGPRYNIILSFIIGLSVITSLLGIL
jgi:D-glucosaminate-specific PTS system IID component